MRVAAGSADCRIGHSQSQARASPAGGACPRFAAAFWRRYFPSLSGEAAVYRKGDADNEVGAGAAQPEDGGGDLLAGRGGRSGSRQ